MSLGPLGTIQYDYPKREISEWPLWYTSVFIVILIYL